MEARFARRSLLDKADGVAADSHASTRLLRSESVGKHADTVPGKYLILKTALAHFQGMAITQLTSASDFRKFISELRLSIVHFYAPWAASCEQVNKVLKDLEEDSKSIPSVGFAFIDAEGVAEVSAMHSIAAAPTVVYFKDGKEVDRVNGYKPSELEMKLTKHSFDIATTPLISQPKPKEDLNTRLERLIKSHRLMLFMKGSPDNPKCGK
ncbi:thioredoxin, partial [Teladorsagia circumcincta]